MEQARELPRSGPVNRVLADRALWKQTIYVMAFLTYLASFFFLGLALAAVHQDGASATVIVDLLLALYFLLQVIFLFALSWFVERRRQYQPIAFPNRRN